MGACIRSEKRGLVTAVALIFGPVLLFGPAAVGVWLYLVNDSSLPETFLLVILVSLVAAILAYLMLENFHWVEFDGRRIRGRRFWTRRLLDYPVEAVAETRPLVSLEVGGSAVGTLIDILMGPVRGYEIRLRDGVRIGLVRYDMTNVDELIQAVEQAVADRGYQNDEG